MRIIAITCDRCRRAVEADLTVIECLGALKVAVGQADLCGPFARASLDWLRCGPAPAATPRVEEVEPSGFG